MIGINRSVRELEQCVNLGVGVVVRVAVVVVAVGRVVGRYSQVLFVRNAIFQRVKKRLPGKSIPSRRGIIFYDLFIAYSSSTSNFISMAMKITPPIPLMMP